MGARLFAGVVALGCALAGMFAAMHHPLWSYCAVGFAVLATALYLSPFAWLFVLPAALPAIGLAPWTGWLTFEEFDLLVLAAAAAGYGRMVWLPARWRPATPPHELQSRPRRRGLSVLSGLAVLAFVASVLASMFRGFSDAGGFSFGWYQGYHEPMNSVRIAKSFLLALLLLPLWQAAIRQDPEQPPLLLSWGMVTGLLLAALSTLWERLAFTDLLDFSSDYRTTGSFWEMHVGGAALDGFLALTVPFAVRELLQAKTPFRWGVASAVLGFAAYACLTTFSRGVYLAIPVGLGVFLALHLNQRRQLTVQAPNGAGPYGLAAALALAIGYAAGATWMFQSSGYRGMAALLGAVVLMLPLVRVLRGFNLSDWLVSVVLTIGLVVTCWVVAMMVPKGAYWAWGLSCLLGLTMLARRSRLGAQLAFAGFCATLASTALVAQHWGGARGLAHAAPVVLTVLFVCVAAARYGRPLWPDAIRWQLTAAGGLAVVAATVGVFGGGAYMGDRFANRDRDVETRLAHWSLGLNMLTTPEEWLLGKGLGRFPANYFLAGNLAQHPGDYRLKQEADNSYLTLTGGLHTNGFGEIFRVSQRVSEPGAAATVSALVRAHKDVVLHFEVCEKHLLYGQGCAGKDFGVKGQPDVWQAIKVTLDGDPPTRGAWYKPRLIAFSVAMDSRGGLADLDNIELNTANGKALLANTDFSAGMAHWFFSSDKHHLPWHIKSVFLNVLFEQGAAGLLVWSLLLLGALLRLAFGQARYHPLAPALAASLVGFAVVGLFDSLLDAPRLGVAFYFLLLVALTTTATPSTSRHSHRLLRAAAGDAADTPANPAQRASYLASPAVRKTTQTIVRGIAILILLTLVGMVSIYFQSGRTPTEWINKIESTAKGKPLAQRALTPLLEGLRGWLQEPQHSGFMTAFTIPPLPRKNISPDTNATSGASLDATALRSGEGLRGRLQVGSGRTLRTVAMAVRVAKDGDVIEIDAGDYSADVTAIDRAALVIRGVGGRARIFASGAHSEGKAIWVIRGGNITVENIEFIGAAVPDQNGAGIRLESGHLTVRNCIFYGNQSGLLTATGDSELVIEQSEFAYNGHGDGLTHQLYVGAIRSLKVTGSYFHHTNGGHLIKSRAAKNFIAYNRLTDESGGRASYELEFPNGGVAHVIGNIIQQGPQSRNSTMVSYGAEGYSNQRNELLLVHNTLVNDMPSGGAFLRVANGAQLVGTRNNIMVGRGRMHVSGPLDWDGDIHAGWEVFWNAARQEYRLNSKGQSQRARPTRIANAADLSPEYEYHHPLGITKLVTRAVHPGALQSTGGPK